MNFFGCQSKFEPKKMKKILTLFGIFLPTGGRNVEPNEKGDYIVRRKLNKNEFNFVLLGDWGGWPAPVYNTPIQLQVAHSMERTAKTWKPEFVYGIGDNFYFWGVTSISDLQFVKT